jgi:hypothetical protein
VETLILEIQRRTLHEYIRIETFPVTIGRALDNDVILSDPTVSPHQLRIDRDESGALRVQNLSGDNVTRKEGKKLGDAPEPLTLPTHFQMGRVKARMLAPDHEVERTRLMGCDNGNFCFFHSKLWALLMPLIAMGYILLDKYLTAFTSKTAEWYLGDTLESVIMLLILAGSISALNRLSIHRWEYMSAWTLSSVILLSLLLQIPLSEFFNYLFSSLLPEVVVALIWTALFLPILLVIYYQSAVHAQRRQALIMTLILCVIPLVLELKDLLSDTLTGPQFESSPITTTELSHLNLHLDPVLTIDAFIEQAGDFEAGEKVP